MTGRCTSIVAAQRYRHSGNCGCVASAPGQTKSRSGNRVRPKLAQQLKIVDVNVSKLVSAMKSQLLLYGQAADGHAGDASSGETALRVEEEATVEVCLSTVAVVVEDHRMQIHPASPWAGEFDADGPPIGLDSKAKPGKRLQRGGFIRSVDRQVQVAVRTGLIAHQRVNTPTTAGPGPAPGSNKGPEHDVHILGSHHHNVAHTARSSWLA